MKRAIPPFKNCSSGPCRIEKNSKSLSGSEFNRRKPFTLLLSLIFFLSSGVFNLGILAAQFEIQGPTGSGTFGESVTVLPNGNFVVIDTSFDLESPVVASAGAVYLYDGKTRALISRLTGGSPFDQIGNRGVTILSNGNFIVRSPFWKNPVNGGRYAGAVTWCSATIGCSGIINATNSLVGQTALDYVGYQEIFKLNNGNYVVHSPWWDNPATGGVNFSAVTWGNGNSGISGYISENNSLIGAADASGYNYSIVKPLANGNYVVESGNWDDPTVGADVGAVTWCNGLTGRKGVVSASNSLIGSTPNDGVGKVVPLTNGNYVVGTGNWNNRALSMQSAGAATWCDGTTGRVGVVSAANSLIGGTRGDAVGNITPLQNGNYVLVTVGWTNPATAAQSAGAVTWGDGTNGTVGVVTEANSMVGKRHYDAVGGNGVTPLTNGHYVIASGQWYNSSLNAIGAVTWSNGNGTTVGSVTAENSLIGGPVSDGSGYLGVLPLANGNYVVLSPSWNNRSSGLQEVGSVTWCNGTGPTSAVVSSANSVVGTTAFDHIGSYQTKALPNGNYVIGSPGWDNPATGARDAGASTWGDGNGGTVGAVNSGNSLVGNAPDDQVSYDIVSLTSGNYVVGSPGWNNPSSSSRAGAATWCNGVAGCTGSITPANSLIGSSVDDSVGTVNALPNGNYVVISPGWDNRATSIQNAGAVTWGNGLVGITGLVTPANSLIGSTAQDNVGSGYGNYLAITPFIDGNYIIGSSRWNFPSPFVPYVGAITLGKGSGGVNGFVTGNNSVHGKVGSGISSSSYDPVNKQLVVGLPRSGTVSIFRSSAIPFDYDGDGKSDISVFRPSSGVWYVDNGSGNTYITQFGLSGDRVAPADFDGDGKTDISVFRPSQGVWYRLNSSDGNPNVVAFGMDGDIPVPGDYDGDGKSDQAIFRPSTGSWWILQSSNGDTNVVQFGASEDIPTPGDFDGDGKADLAVYRPSVGGWYRIDSATGSIFALNFGISTDKPVPADYDGDGKTDIAVFRPSNRTWYRVLSLTGTVAIEGFGIEGDKAVPADYDGDGRADLAVFRPDSGIWFVQRTTTGSYTQQFGINEDIPTPNAFVP